MGTVHNLPGLKTDAVKQEELVFALGVLCEVELKIKAVKRRINKAAADEKQIVAILLEAGDFLADANTRYGSLVETARAWR